MHVCLCFGIIAIWCHFICLVYGISMHTQWVRFHYGDYISVGPLFSISLGRKRMNITRNKPQTTTTTPTIKKQRSNTQFQFHTLITCLKCENGRLRNRIVMKLKRNRFQWLPVHWHHDICGRVAFNWKHFRLLLSTEFRFNASFAFIWWPQVWITLHD